MDKLLSKVTLVSQSDGAKNDLLHIDAVIKSSSVCSDTMVSQISGNWIFSRTEKKHHTMTTYRHSLNIVVYLHMIHIVC